MLDHLELPCDIGVQGNEQHSSLGLVIMAVCTIRLPSFAIGPAAPDDAMHLGKMQRRFRIGPEGVARICPPDVRADRAAQAGTVLVVVEEIVLRIFLASIGLLGDQRFAVLPPAKQACGNPIVGLVDFPGYIGNKGVEGRDILFELAKYKIGAVPPDIPIMPVGDTRLALVLVAKQELARLYLGVRPDLGFPVPGIGVFALFRATLDLRLRKPVLKAEVLLLFVKELTP